PMTKPSGSNPASSIIRNSLTERSLVKSRGGPPSFPRISSRRCFACSGIRRTSARFSLISCLLTLPKSPFEGGECVGVRAGVFHQGLGKLRQPFLDGDTLRLEGDAAHDAGARRRQRPAFAGFEPVAVIAQIDLD